MHIARTILLLSLLPLAGAGCARTAPEGAPPVTSTAADRYSIYDLGSTWTDQHGTPRGLETLRGRPRAVAMIYTECGATCPITVGEMKRIAASTPAGLGLVLVSLDPDRDSPAHLARYAETLGLDSARWTLLTAPDNDVRELSATIGVRYRRMSPAEIAHASVITLLDASGAVVHQQVGLDGTEETIRIARAIAH
jgi:protein SCO1